MHGHAILKGSRWVYVGPGGGSGLIHTVIDITRGITTWSDPVKNPANEAAGWSWFGPAIDFLKSFKMEPTPPPAPTQETHG
jgi:hypothetical protein